jgi:glycerol dehydrogenase
MSRAFESPARYVQGRDVTAEIGAYVASLGETALVLGDGLVLGLVGDGVTTGLADGRRRSRD